MPKHRTIAGINALAEHLDTSERHIRGLVARRAIPYFKVGAFVRFDLDEIDEWLELHRVEEAS